MNRVLAPALLLVVWLALWGEISVINVGSGLVVVTVVSLLLRRVEPPAHRLRPVGLVRLLAVFVWRLVRSSANVVATVVAPSSTRLRSGVVGIELSHPSPLVATIVADAISLTPGTLTLEARAAGDETDQPRPPTLFVHVLGLADADDVRRDVRRLEALVLSAVTPMEPASGPPKGPSDRETSP